jgi:hypothetical protein
VTFWRPDRRFGGEPEAIEISDAPNEVQRVLAAHFDGLIFETSEPVDVGLMRVEDHASFA